MNRKTRRMRKMLLMIASLALVLGIAIGGTIAWLMDKTDPVVNTFSPSDISITLTEENPVLVEGAREAKMVPGCDIAKNPKVTVVGGSEACWLFVKIEKSTNYNTYLEDYEVAGGWTELTSEEGVYYRQVSATDAENGVSYYVLEGKGEGDLANGYVTVRKEVTVANMEAAANSKPTLTFTAYAIQSANLTADNSDVVLTGTQIDTIWGLAKAKAQG